MGIKHGGHGTKIRATQKNSHMAPINIAQIEIDTRQTKKGP